MNLPQSIFEYIKTEESRFDSDEIRVGDNWMWNMKNHLQMIFHLKNGLFFTGNNDWMRAFKNIMEPILNLSYWAEDIELTDVIFFIENEAGRALSFLFKKYHDEVYVKETNLDTLFDEITEDDLDYGGVLVQKGKESKPERLELLQLAFCDQTDIQGGPIGFKYYFSPDKLRKMEASGWGQESNGATMSIQDLIVYSDQTKESSGAQTQDNKTTGKNIEVYMVRGPLPESYLEDNDNTEDWYNQVHIVAFYENEKKSNGCTLYRKKEEEGNIKFHTSKKIAGRALGRGVGEGLLHPQIWTNFLEIHKMNLLQSASKVPLQTTDPAYANRNKIQDMENLEITVVEDGKQISQIPTASPVNVQLFEKSINEWYEQAQLTGSAFDPLLGKQQTSGTTFRGQERVVFQGRGLHERRRGQRAKFIEEIYRDWIIPDIKKKIMKGKEFLAELTMEEMAWVSDKLADSYADKEQVEAILNGRVPEDREVLRQKCLQDFTKKGNKHLFKILKDEFKDAEVKMGINISAKQKDLMGMTDKLLSVFQFASGNPQGFQQVMQIPGMSEAFNDILEYSGLSPINFAQMQAIPMQLPQPQQPQQMNPEALQGMAPKQPAIA